MSPGYLDYYIGRERDCKLPKGRTTSPNISGQCQASVPGFSARLECSWEYYYLVLTDRKMKLILKKPSGKSPSVTSCKYLLQNDLSEPLWRTYPPLGLPTFTLFLSGNTASQNCFPTGCYLILHPWRKFGSFQKLDTP